MGQDDVGDISEVDSTPPLVQDAREELAEQQRQAREFLREQAGSGDTSDAEEEDKIFAPNLGMTFGVSPGLVGLDYGAIFGAVTEKAKAKQRRDEAEAKRKAAIDALAAPDDEEAEDEEAQRLRGIGPLAGADRAGKDENYGFKSFPGNRASLTATEFRPENMRAMNRFYDPDAPEGTSPKVYEELQDGDFAVYIDRKLQPETLKIGTPEFARVKAIKQRQDRLRRLRESAPPQTGSGDTSRPDEEKADDTGLRPVT